MADFYNRLAEVAVWQYILFVVIFLIGSSLYRAELERPYIAHMAQPLGEGFWANVRRGLFTYGSTFWSTLWLILQVIAVILGIIGGTLALGVYFGWFPESMASETTPTQQAPQTETAPAQQDPQTDGTSTQEEPQTDGTSTQEETPDNVEPSETDQNQGETNQ